MLPKKACKHCGDPEPKHWPYQCRQNKATKKSIKRQSDREIAYQTWLVEVARPYLISRGGNVCACCLKTSENVLDIDHKLNKGSRPDLKMSLDNLQLLCRYPCHYNKTNNTICQH